MEVMRYLTCAQVTRPPYQMMRKFVKRCNISCKNQRWSHLCKCAFEWYARVRNRMLTSDILELYYIDEPLNEEKKSALNYIQYAKTLRQQLDSINQQKFLQGFDNFVRF